MRKFHSIAWVPVEFPPGQALPLIALDNGQILYEVWWFFRLPSVRDHSPSWFEKAAHYIGSFYDFFRATRRDGVDTQLEADKLIADCISAFEHGTIQPNGVDGSGLFWKPWSPSKVAHAKSVLRTFCRSLEDLCGSQNPMAASRFATMAVRSFGVEQKKYHSKLFHLSFRKSAQSSFSRRGAFLASGIIRFPNVKVFPRELVAPLIFQGCLRDRSSADFGHDLANRYNIPLMMSLLLLAGGGLRKSELFHIFTDDVRPTEIRLYDPVVGRMAWPERETGRVRVGQRASYLSDQFGLVPRNRLGRGDTQQAGWKAMLYDHGEPHFYAVVHWINGRQRKLFHQLYRVYRDHVMPAVALHPYLLISLSHGEFGRPWTIGAFNDAFGEALGRIGEKPSADRGITPHGLRHLYGQTLVDMRLSPLVIQHAMHHKSIESQIVYTKPSQKRVREALEAAADFDSDHGYSMSSEVTLVDYSWKSDPLQIFSPWALGGRH